MGVEVDLNKAGEAAARLYEKLFDADLRVDSDQAVGTIDVPPAEYIEKTIAVYALFAFLSKNLASASDIENAKRDGEKVAELLVEVLPC